MKMTFQGFAGAMLILALGLPVSGATIGNFTGGDSGEGLDLDGTFAYAISKNDGVGPLTIRNATFTPDNATLGVVLNNWNAEIDNWVAPNYGASPNDDKLEAVMNSIRHVGTLPGTGSIDLAVTAGQQYKLQMMYQEGCCNRGFDISIDGTLVQDDFWVGPIDGAPTSGTVFSHTFFAADNLANIVLDGGAGGHPDTNPTFYALTLEAVPEPASCVLLGLGALSLCLVALRRQNA